MQISYGVAARIVLLLGLLIATGAPSQGAPIQVKVFSDNVLVQDWDSTALGCDQGALPPGTEGCAIANQPAGAFQINNLNLTLQSRAITNAVISVDNLDTNLVTGSHRFTVDIILTIPSTGLNQTGISGTLAGSITDGITDPDDPGNDVATMTAPAGSALYTALLDNVVFAPGTMRPNPYQLGPTATSASLPPTNFGVPNPPGQLGPPISSTITLRYDFTLTPRDQAGLNGSLRTTVVPEPGTAMLLGLGLAALARAGRRR